MVESSGQIPKSAQAAEECLVSVVIPTIGRPSLVNAIESVINQELSSSIQVIVVFDLAASDVSSDAASAALRADKILYTGGGKRGCHARNLGVAVADGEWVAFLDDDDTWVPTKLGEQLMIADALRAQGKRAVVGSRATLAISNDKSVVGVPSKLIGAGENVEDYLFRRRRPGSRRASFFTSSILAERQLCVEVPWDESLSRHQDWDWLVRVGRMEKVAFAQCESDLIVYNVGSEGSISAKAEWAPSLLWGTSILAGSSAKTRVDFMAAQTLRYAFHMRDFRGVCLTIRAIVRSRTIPSLGPIFIGLAGLMPRNLVQKLMAVIK